MIPRDPLGPGLEVPGMKVMKTFHWNKMTLDIIRPLAAPEADPHVGKADRTYLEE